MTRITRTVAVVAFALAAGSLVACSSQPAAAPAPAPVTVTVPAPAPTPATPSLNPEAAYLQDLESSAVVPTYGSEASALRFGYSVCISLRMGQTQDQIVASLTEMPKLALQKIVASAAYHLCQ